MKAFPSANRLSACRPALLGALFFACSFSSGHGYEWIKRAGVGPYNWDDAGNWDANGVPVSPASGVIAVYNSGATFTLEYDRTEDLRIGGTLLFRLGSVGPGTVTFDLNGKKLILDGGTLRFEAGTSASGRDGVIIRDGTVQFGTGGSAGDLVLGGTDVIYSTSASNIDPYVLVFGAGSVLDSRNLQHIGVVDDAVNAKRNLVLDLRAATFQSGISGGEAGVLTVQESIAVGNTTISSVTDGNEKTGLLRMGGASQINIGTDLIVGQYIRATTGSAAASNKVSGTLEMLSTHSETTLNIGRDLRVGVGDRATGSFTSTPKVLNISLGNAATAPSERGVLYVGYKHVSQGNTNGDTLGSFVGGTEGGDVVAYVKEFRVGQNTRTAGSARGVLDFRHSSTILIDIAGDAVIGNGFDGAGKVYLSRGVASSQTLDVGSATGTAERSVLSLGETRWSVAEDLMIGALGEVYVTATDAGGLDLISGDAGAFSITDGGFLEAVFDDALGDDSLWAFRWAGQHETALAAYLASGKLRATGAFGGDATVFYDGEYTYFGLAQAIPEPGTLLLLGVAGGIGMFALRSRRLL